MKYLLGLVLVILALFVKLSDGYSVSPGCYYNGQTYDLDSDIENNGCSGLYCTSHGHVASWISQDCEEQRNLRNLASLLSSAKKIKTKREDGAFKM